MKKSKEDVKQMKFEFFFNKAAQDPQKPGQNSGQSVENRTILGESILFSTIWNRTIPGIVLSEFVLSGDPLYKSITEDSFWNIPIFDIDSL